MIFIFLTAVPLAFFLSFSRVFNSFV
jgi:hypothetical protein